MQTGIMCMCGVEKSHLNAEPGRAAPPTAVALESRGGENMETGSGSEGNQPNGECGGRKRRGDKRSRADCFLLGCKTLKQANRIKVLL